MATYTTRKRLEKQTPGDNNNTWGTLLNSNTIDIIDECFGVVCVAMTTAGDSTLSQANGSTDEGRRSQIILTGAPTSDVRLFVPAAQSFYLVRNKMTGTKRVRLTNNGGTNGVDFSGTGSGAEQGILISDGTNVREVFRTTSIGAFGAITSTITAGVSDGATLDTTGGAANDKLYFFDQSETGGPGNRVPVSNFFTNALSDFTDEPSVAVSDSLTMFDISGSVARGATVQNVFKAFNGLTEETTAPVSTTFMLAYETSVGVPRKISVQNSTKFVNSGTKTGAYTVTTGDRNGSITYSGMSADVTLTLPAAATFGIGNIFWFSHEDTGINPAYAVTFDPNGAETIDGATTRPAYAGTRIGVMAISGGWKTICGNWVVLSSQQTINLADNSNFAHGQPTAPFKVDYFLINVITEGGYAVGDRINVETGDRGSTSDLGYVVGGNATNLFYVVADTGFSRFFNKTTGDQVSPTAANWRLVLVGTF